MSRRPRLFIPGAIYHVYCRVARGEFIFDDQPEAAEFIETLREVRDLDGLSILGQDREYSIQVGLRMLTLRHIVEERDGLYSVVPSEQALLAYYANSIAHHVAVDPPKTVND